MSGTEKAPGLVWRKRRNGSLAAYWTARRDLVKAGYRPKTVRLHYAPGDPELLSRCHVLQAEMLAWATSGGHGTPSPYDGTFNSLVRLFETDPDSPYRDLRPATQRTYSKTMAALMKHKGQRRVDRVNGAVVKRWYKELVGAHSKGWAYYTINVLKTVLAYGATRRFTDCHQLRLELREARFHAPSGRKERLTYKQVRAFCATAHATGFVWMALCLTLQFDLSMRRRDVIGEYVEDDNGEAGIRFGKKVWRDGLTWAHIDTNGIVRKLISKTAFTSGLVAVHAIADYPDLVAELALIPESRRIGPIVIHHRTGLPPTEAQCRRYFRVIARKAGLPDNLWQMDARAGAVTEAYEAEATTEEAMALGTHSESKTSRGYLRDLTEQSHRAAVKRVSSRRMNEERG
jgi:hypothetical protein